VLVTHLHADHVGMAGWLTRRSGGRLWMTRLEYLTTLAMAGEDATELSPDAMAFYRRAGWDGEAIARYGARLGRFQSIVHPLPDSYRRIRDGETLRIGGRDWRVIVGAGHCPEHACLYSEDLRLLISGDQVLPRISSNVSVQPREPDADPLAEWVASLHKLQAAVPPDVLVLPAHNEPFTGLHARLVALEASMLRKLGKLRSALGQPCRVVDVFALLFAGPMTSDDAMRYSLATGEALAHLNYLLNLGEVEAREDASGVAWYRVSRRTHLSEPGVVTAQAGTRFGTSEARAPCPAHGDGARRAVTPRVAYGASSISRAPGGAAPCRPR
jgi:glyoxylase-like metal-dependent hydrolase (beta-lactamase superfamily II)